MNNPRPKYFFRGVEGRCNSDAFADYINSKLDHWKMDIWQLGTDDIDSEWNSLRPPLDCECRGRIVESEQKLEFEFRYWYFVHALRCLKDDEQKIEEFAEPLLEVIEKEGQAFWAEKEAVWTRIEQKVQEVSYNFEKDDVFVGKNLIMNCRNEADLFEEEQAQITYLNRFQNHKPSPQQTQREQQTQARATQRQQKQTEEKQKDEEFIRKITEEVQKNNSATPVHSHSQENKNNNHNNSSKPPVDNPPPAQDKPSSPPKESPQKTAILPNKSEPIPVKLVIGVIVIAVLITLGLLILFFKKKKKKHSN